MRESRMSGSVGAAGEQSPAATRPNVRFHDSVPKRSELARTPMWAARKASARLTEWLTDGGRPAVRKENGTDLFFSRISATGSGPRTYPWSCSSYSHVTWVTSTKPPAVLTAELGSKRTTFTPPGFIALGYRIPSKPRSRT
jgi:hypothetical protein